MDERKKRTDEWKKIDGLIGKKGVKRMNEKKKIDKWMNEKKKIDKWMDGKKKIDKWMDGKKKRKDEWIEKRG